MPLKMGGMGRGNRGGERAQGGTRSIDSLKDGWFGELGGRGAICMSRERKRGQAETGARVRGKG